MTGSGTVRRIHIAPAQGAPMTQVTQVRAIAGRGLEGDRYCLSADEQPGTTATPGTFVDRDGSDLTLIESETVAAIEREYEISLDTGAHRRNVTTDGVALNHLVGDRFRVGEAVCEGTELCEPCAGLEAHLEQAGVREALVHRGGLRARILDGGRIQTGDPIERL